jgi:hypothetical protein
MVRSNHAVESRTLARSCLENFFLISDLHQRGEDSVKDMRSHDAHGKISLGKIVLTHPGVADGPLSSVFERLKERERLKQPKRLTVRDTAKGGDIERMYADYALLSHDAAHPSLTALDRHFRLVRGHMTLTVMPPFKPEERLATLDMACEALLAAWSGVGSMLGGTSQRRSCSALGALFGSGSKMRRSCPMTDLDGEIVALRVSDVSQRRYDFAINLALGNLLSSSL